MGTDTVQAPVPQAAPTQQVSPVQPAATVQPGSVTSGISDAWHGFFADLQKDPSLRAALIQFGARAMQPIQPNQTVSGVLGDALSTSAAYLQKLRSGETADATRKRELDMQQQQINAATSTAKANERRAIAAEQAAAESAKVAIAKLGVEQAKAAHLGDPKLIAEINAAAQPASVKELNAMADALVTANGLDPSDPKVHASALLYVSHEKAQEQAALLAQKLAGAAAVKTAIPGFSAPPTPAPDKKSFADAFPDLFHQAPTPDFKSATHYPSPAAMKAKTRSGQVVPVDVVGEDQNYYYGTTPDGKSIYFPKGDTVK